jgi:hypothetical protein
LYIDSKILFEVVLYNSFSRTRDLRSTLGPLGVKGHFKS